MVTPKAADLLINTAVLVACFGGSLGFAQDFRPIGNIHSGEKPLGFVGRGDQKHVIVSSGKKLIRRGPTKSCCIENEITMNGKDFSVVSPPDASAQWAVFTSSGGNGRTDAAVNLKSGEWYSLRDISRKWHRPDERLTVHTIACENVVIGTVESDKQAGRYKVFLLELVNSIDSHFFETAPAEFTKLAITSVDCTASGLIVALLRVGSIDQVWTFDAASGKAIRRATVNTIFPSDRFGKLSLLSLRSIGQEFLVAGTTHADRQTDSDVFVAKLRSDFSVLWGRRCGGTRSDDVVRIESIDRGASLISAKTDSKEAQPRRDWLLLLDDQGDLIWERKIDNQLGMATIIRANGAATVYLIPRLAVDVYQIMDPEVQDNAVPETRDRRISSGAKRNWNGVYAWTRTIPTLFSSDREASLTCVNHPLDKEELAKIALHSLNSRAAALDLKMLKDRRKGN